MVLGERTEHGGPESNGRCPPHLSSSPLPTPADGCWPLSPPHSLASPPFPLFLSTPFAPSLHHTGCRRLLAPSPFHSLLLRLHPASSLPISSLMLLTCFAPLPAPHRMRTAARLFTSPPRTAMQASSASCAASGHPRTLHPRSRCVVNTPGLLLQGCLCLICFATRFRGHRNMVVAREDPAPAFKVR